MFFFGGDLGNVLVIVGQKNLNMNDLPEDLLDEDRC